jgi:predicted metalloprotease
MRWIPGGRSTNIEDRRGEGPRMGFPGGGRGLGCGGVVILLLLSIIFKTDFFQLFQGAGGGNPAQETSAPSNVPIPESSQEADLVQFVSFVLDDVQNTWSGLFPSLGGTYEPAKLVLFRDAIQSACGFAESATGPFYCPADQKVYVDLGFYDDLRERFGAPGDFAQAYVIAHELGHHAQRLLGIEQQVRNAQRNDPESANELSVRLELQADCFAGVWGHSAAQRNILEAGDLEEGLNAAAAIGDDRIQRNTSGRVSPESWTHGSSEMRVEWLKRGLESGRCEDCDTFGTGGR